MSEAALKALEEVEAALAEANNTLQRASRQLTEDHRIVLGGRKWGEKTMTRVYEALSLLLTLRAALAPVADAEIEAIRGRHEVLALKHPNIDWNEPNVWADRATLLRAYDAMKAENERLREALKAMLAHSCVADAGGDMKDEDDHAAERLARAALGQECGG